MVATNTPQFYMSCCCGPSGESSCVPAALAPLPIEAPFAVSGAGGPVVGSVGAEIGLAGLAED